MSAGSGDRPRRVALVTGAGTGIGRAVARTFAAEGYHVVIVGRTEQTLVATAAGNDSIFPLVMDITGEDAPSAVIDAALARFGRLDVLVNNAGIAEPCRLGELTAESIDRQIAVNLRAPMLLVGRAIEPLAESGGIVINLSSAGSTGQRGWPQFSVYGATKVGIDFLTRTWAVELAPLGIRVLAVAPGVIDRGAGGPMGADSEQYQQFLAGIAQRTPLRRVGEPAEIAWWIARLAQPEAAFATGTVLVVDGGLSFT